MKLFYDELWKAEAAAGALLTQGYRRRERREPRAGEFRVLAEDGYVVEWSPFIWDSLMLERLLTVDRQTRSEAERPWAPFEALRVLSFEFPDRERALKALQQLEASEKRPARGRALVTETHLEIGTGSLA